MPLFIWPRAAEHFNALIVQEKMVPLVRRLQGAR